MFQFGVRASGIRVTAPSGPTIQMLRGAQLRSAYHTLSGSGMNGLLAPRFQPETVSEPQMTAGPFPQEGSRVNTIGVSAVPDSAPSISPRYSTPSLKTYVCAPLQ